MKIKTIITRIVLIILCLFSILFFSLKNANKTVASYDVTYNVGFQENQYTFNIAITELEDNMSFGQKSIEYFKYNSGAVVHLSESIVGAVNSWTKQGSSADHLRNSFNLAKDLIVLATAFGGAGPIASTISTVIDNLLTIGESRQSEIQDLQNVINSQFEAVHEHIDEVQKDITELSKKTDQNTKTILSAIKSATELAYARGQVSEFFSSGSGNFNYNQFNSFVCGSTDPKANTNYYNQAYYQRLMNLISSGHATDEDLKVAYNDLYRNLMSTKNGDSNINMFYNYLLGDEIGNSIIDYYYVYMLYNKDYFGNKIEFDAVDLLLDMCKTAYLADACINMCNTYFVVELFKEYGAKLYTNPDSCWYHYGYGDDEKISYTELMGYSKVIEERESRLEKQFVKDIAFITNMKGSYTVQDGSDFWIASYNEDNYGNLLTGDKIYLNMLSDKLCDSSYLDIDIFDFTYKIYNTQTGEYIKTINNGYFTVDSSLPNKFTIKAFFRDFELYAMDFKVNSGTGYSGGKGTIDDPYLISNADQFKMITTSKGIYYKLIRDIDISNVSAIGSNTDKFQGHLDGNFHTLKNFKCENINYAGIFRYIGENGWIGNLNLDTIKVTVSNLPDNNVYVGGLAGVSEGTIYNCNISNVEITVTRTDSVDSSATMNSSVNYYVGGLVGQLTRSATITYSQLSTAKITGTLSRFYASNDDDKNSINLHLGGLLGRTEGSSSINYCRALSGSELSGSIRNECDKNLSTRYPYGKTCVGGILGSAAAETIKNLDSSVEESKITSTVADFNRGVLGFSGDKNLYPYKGQFIGYYPGTSDTVYKGSTWTSPTKPASTSFSYEYISVTPEEDPKEEDPKEEPEPSYSYGQIYQYGVQTFNRGGLLINSSTQYTIISIYDFDTTTSTINNDKESTLKVLISKDGQLGMIEIPYLVEKAKPTSLYIRTIEEEDSFTFMDYDTGVLYPEYREGEEMLAVNTRDTIKVNHGEQVLLVYENGYEEDVTKKLTSKYYYDGDTKKLNTFSDKGFIKVYAEYAGLSAVYTVYVACDHHFVDEAVAPTCASVGYTRHTCTNCGYIYRDNLVPVNDNHHYVLTGAVDATCTHDGYTGNMECEYCHNISSFGHYIGALGHDFHPDDENDNYHKCSICGVKEEHFIINSESGNYIIQTCAVCHHQTEIVKKNTEIPHVVISTSYALENTIVTVYVQLLNNPGLTSASFCLKYDNRLSLVDWYQGDVLNNSIYSVTAKDGLVYFTCVEPDTDDSNGNLLRLLFKVPEHAEIGECFDVNISTTNSTSQFTDKNGETIEIISYSGEVIITDHLPGDVNSDGVVDICDVVLISVYCNNVDGSLDEKLDAAHFDIQYADVNFDNKVNTEDMVRILRYLVGGYNCQLLGEEFKVIINYNDGKTVPTTKVIKKGDTYASLGYASTDGYRFDGWYKDVDSTDPMDPNDLIKFDNAQYQDTEEQIYYAHWSINSITYNTGIEGVELPYADYSTSGEEYTLNSDLVKTIQIKLIDSLNIGDVAIQSYKIKVIGWATEPGGEKVYDIGQKINLKTSNPDEAIGSITLYPVWEEVTFNLPDRVSGNKDHYSLSYWYEDDDINKPHVVGEECKLTKDTSYYAHWKEYIYYVEYNGNGADFSITDSETVNWWTGSFKITNTVPERNYYIFKGWSINRSDDVPTHVVGDTIYQPEYVTDNNQIVTLYAVWEYHHHDVDENCVCHICGQTVHGIGKNDAGYCEHIENGTRYIYFGSYPKTKLGIVEAEETNIVTALNEKAGELPTSYDAKKWSSLNYYKDGALNNCAWFIDLTFQGIKYRGIYLKNYRGNSVTPYQKEVGYELETTYWFKYEPIKWQVLNDTDGTLFLLSVDCLDAQSFGISNNYKDSNLRAWLNSTFYNSAFTDADKTYIQLTNVDNSARSTNPAGNPYQINAGKNAFACDNTADYIFVPSVQEMTGYGFGGDWEEPDSKRIKARTEYAISQSTTQNATWWLRSPLPTVNNEAYEVLFNGKIHANEVGASNFVVPAIYVKFK